MWWFVFRNGRATSILGKIIMQTTAIKGQQTKSKGRFQTITLSNKSGTETFVGKVKKIGKTFITFDRFSGQRGEVKAHFNSVKSIR